MPKLISPNQGAFVRGRAITDNIALTQEICREVGRKGKRQNVIFSLDMHKAYDRVEWDFLAAVLLQFGFCQTGSKSSWHASLRAIFRWCSKECLKASSSLPVV